MEKNSRMNGRYSHLQEMALNLRDMKTADVSLPRLQSCLAGKTGPKG